MRHPATAESPLPPADIDVDPGPLVWDELADRWEVLKALLARQVDSVENLAAELSEATDAPA